jgi:cell filamentation protein
MAGPSWWFTQFSPNAGFSIDWAKTDKSAYLLALTKELATPGKGLLDDYLKPFVVEPVAYERMADTVIEVPGLAGGLKDANVVLGKTSQPEVQARYQQQKISRGAT